jgi:hypothetical protein
MFGRIFVAARFRLASVLESFAWRWIDEALTGDVAIGDDF